MSPLLLLTACFAGGIALADRADLGCGAWLGLGLLGGILALCRRGGAPGAALLCVAAGGLAIALRLAVALDHDLDGEVRATLEGTVASALGTPSGARIVLTAVRNADPEGPRLPARVELHAPREGAAGLERALPGERWRLRARLRPPRGRANPGRPARAGDLRRRGIGAVARPVEPALAVRLPGREGPRWLAPVHRARRRAAERLVAHGRGGALLAALGLGERGGMPLEARDAFARLGVAHLLAVSGLHLALGAALLYALGRRLLARLPRLAAAWDVRALALGLACAGACAQALLCGFGVPVRRALVLVLATAVSVGRGRPARRAHPLALAALGVLAFDPAALFDVGAQLSFVASAALLLARRADPPAGRLGRIAGVLRTPATAGAATAPLVARAFGGVSPAGLLANAIAVPWVAGVLLPLALGSALLALVAPPLLAEPLLGPAAGLAALTLDALEAAALVVPARAGGGAPAAGFWLAAVAVAGASLAARPTGARVLAWVAVVALLGLAPQRAILPLPPRLVALDVGHGDAVVVQGREAALLVDGALALPDGLDLGRREVVPALAALGIRRLDLVVATHADLDHRGGLPSVLSSLPVSALWLPFGGRADPGFATLLAAAARHGVRVSERGAGSPARAFGDLLVEPLWPPPGTAARSRNDGSLVVRVRAGGVGVLLAGDVGPSSEQGLAWRGDLAADVLLLPHHGSRTSSSRALLDAVDPLVVVASASCGGRHRTPHPEVIARLRERRLPLWWTGRDGAVIVGLGEPLVARGLGPVAARCWAEPRGGRSARGRLAAGGP